MEDLSQSIIIGGLIGALVGGIFAYYNVKKAKNRDVRSYITGQSKRTTSFTTKGTFAEIADKLEKKLPEKLFIQRSREPEKDRLVYMDKAGLWRPIFYYPIYFKPLGNGKMELEIGIVNSFSVKGMTRNAPLERFKRNLEGILNSK